MYCSLQVVQEATRYLGVSERQVRPAQRRTSPTRFASRIAHRSLSDQHVDQGVGDIEAIKTRTAEAEVKLSAAVARARDPSGRIRNLPRLRSWNSLVNLEEIHEAVQHR